MEFLDILVSLVALVILEIVLGIDNLVILSILTEKLPPVQRKKARQFGLMGAWVSRLVLLGSAVYLVKLTQPLCSIGDLSFSARDIFLCLGGLFLIWKATEEIHRDLLNELPDIAKPNLKVSFRAVVIQIILFDLVFSIDSVLTAVGLTSRFWVMSAAITCSIIIMIWASDAVSRFIDKNPTLKILALSYLILIGMVLIADGFSLHIPRGYLYFAMGFSLSVESINLYKRSKRK